MRPQSLAFRKEFLRN